ncbi:MAG: hydroxymethylbilane synthase, partial [Ktedonobacterales bacterium]
MAASTNETGEIARRSLSASQREKTAVVGSRGSALALWQTNWVLDRLRERAPEARFRIEEIKTRGDHTQSSNVPLTLLGDKSMFVAELERALLAGELDVAIQPMNDLALMEDERGRGPRGPRGHEWPAHGAGGLKPVEGAGGVGGDGFSLHTPAPALQGREQPEAVIDAAVHSLKDLPGKLDRRLVLAAITERADPRDALVSRSGLGLLQLPAGATVATSSLRRKAQVLHARPDLRVVDIRGNVDTRLRKALAPDGPDATILAVAGLLRLGLESNITELLPVEVMVPAVGQGALAVEVRASDRRLRRLLRQINSAPTQAAVAAERAVLATLGGGCQVPLGAHATIAPDGATLRLLAVVASLDGRRLVRVERAGPVRRP